ncbi:hypothetical protein L6452_13696 [Arctium lappa]|uniref:Uncharacterized protein n=2 Tax=Arctium lappa TaxID=4217 RepID=A0ACB9CJ20_ARCLA|nr:hypothetical protein L6452_13686 [Arctium lappa]KAI3734231.1 hypothetical protein L6452_13696 [Arctium lappa]
MLEENSILDRYGNFYDPADQADNIWWTIDQEETLVFEEAVDNPFETRTGSGLSEETITRRLQASAAREKSGKGEEDESDDVCAIWLDEYDDEYKKMGRLECGHGLESAAQMVYIHGVSKFGANLEMMP